MIPTVEAQVFAYLTSGKPVVADDQAITAHELIELETGRSLGDGEFSTSGLPAWP